MQRQFPSLFILLTIFILTSCSSPAPASPTEQPYPPPTIAASPLPAYPQPEQGESQPSGQSPFTLSSSAFEAESPIPERYTCHGEDISPPLAWSQPPDGTLSLALIMDDPDALPVAGFIWDHWVLFNLPPDLTALPEGLTSANLPAGAREGMNSFKRTGYGGPCPPSGQTHRYVFSLYALDTTLALSGNPTKDMLFEAMQGHILAQAQLAGTFTAP